MDGYGLRYHFGVQSVIAHNRATASAPSSAGGDAPEQFWGQFKHQGNRFVAHVGRA